MHRHARSPIARLITKSFDDNDMNYGDDYSADYMFKRSGLQPVDSGLRGAQQKNDADQAALYRLMSLYL